MEPCFAFYDWRGTGFLMCQDETGHPVPKGVVALNLWHEKGEPYVADYAHAVTLGLVPTSADVALFRKMRGL